MIRILLISLISSVLLIGLIESAPINLSQNAYAIKKGSCPNMNFLWEHTYGVGKTHLSPGQTHSRLKYLAECVVFDGEVRSTPTSTEGDGDVSFNAMPDAQVDKDLININNTKALSGALHIEVICGKVPDSSYINKFGPYCDNAYPSHINTTNLKAGTHVRVTGKWVTDVGYPTPGHLEWNEIHPVESIQILS